MHEFSIAQSLFLLIDRYAQENLAKKVVKVNIKIGKWAGVEIHSLEMALNFLKEKTIARSAEFILESQNLVFFCKTCRRESSAEQMIFECEHCASVDLEVLQGQEMILESIELET